MGITPQRGSGVKGMDLKILSETAAALFVEHRLVGCRIRGTRRAGNE